MCQWVAGQGVTQKIHDTLSFPHASLPSKSVLQYISFDMYIYTHMYVYIHIPVVPHEAVAEVSKSNLYINQKKNDVPIEIVCVTCFNPSHFAQPLLNALSNMRPGSSRRSQNRTTLTYLTYLDSFDAARKDMRQL